MCQTKQCRRDRRQLSGLIMRFTAECKTWGNVAYMISPTLNTIICLLIAAFIYDPVDLQMKATEQFYVTATDETSFVDVSSGFTTKFSLHNCTLYKRFEIGLVRQDKNGNEEGFVVLEQAFQELADRYATDESGNFEMTSRIFTTSGDLDDYVESWHYQDKPLCYAIAWNEFNAAIHTFALDLRMNFGDILSPRFPQTEYEESSQNQLYLEQYANTGMLQTMTTVTSKLLSEVYQVPQDSFKFEMMYMPMDSGTFQNDNFAEVLTALLAFTCLAVANVPTRILQLIADPNEPRIQEMLRRLGMRKIVDACFEMFFMCLVVPSLLPVLVSIGVAFIIPTTSWSFFFVQVIIFQLRTTSFSWIIRFTIDNHVAAEVVEVVFEVIQIALVIYSNVLIKINPQFILGASFCLPIMFITQTIRLGVIASNKGINVELGQANVIVNNNDMTEIMYFSLIALSLQCLYLLYTLPFKIFNDPKKLWGPLYLCSPSWWRCSDGQDNEIADEGTSSAELHEDEKKMIERGQYEEIEAIESTNFMQLSRVNVEQHGHHPVHNLSLTLRAGETFVIIGENGAGKSMILQTIAGMHHVHSGEATAFGYDLFKASRFMRDNFLTFGMQEPVLSRMMTPEQHIGMLCIFLGVENIKQKIKQTLAIFNLNRVGKISAGKLSLQDKKMLSFAMSMLGNTRVILLDEPTQGMDTASKRIVWETIQRHKKDHLILIATQDMKEACALGDRIGLISHGALKLCGTPNFFAQKFKHSIQIVFLPKEENSDVNELKELVKSAVRVDHDVDVYNQQKERQVVAKLPPGIQYQTLNECIDMGFLHAQQGRMFKSLKIQSISFTETFDAMLETVKDDDDHPQNRIRANIGTFDSNFEQTQLLDSDQIIEQHEQYQMRRVSLSESLKALLIADFKSKAAVRQMAVVSCIILVALLQETIGLYFLTNLNQPTISYSSVKETFEENGPPILIFANAETPTGSSTEALFTRYNSIVNEEPNSVMIETLSWVPQADSTVQETMTEAAVLYYEEMEKFVEEQEKEAFAAYYIYNIDTTTNYYAIGVYGNQLAAASCPTFGATMLQTLAQEVTGNQEVKIEFYNKQLPSNNVLTAANKPGIAETYGVSILAAILVVQLFQIRIFGKPISSGFFSSYTASGGRKFAYFLSKYTKAVLAGTVMMVIVLILMYSQKFNCYGLPVFLTLWVLGNSFYIFLITAWVTLLAKESLGYAEKSAVMQIQFFGIAALIIAGTVSFSNNFWTLLGLFYANVPNPSFLLLLNSQLGFSYQTVLIKNNQMEEEVELNPWQNPDSSLSALIIQMSIFSLLWAAALWKSNYIRTDTVRYFCMLPATPPPIEDTEDVNATVRAEKQKVSQLMHKPTDYILIVDNLQTFKFLRNRDLTAKAAYGQYLGPVYNHSRSSRGQYTTKGVSFAVQYGERLVFLDPSHDGAEDLLLTLVGQKKSISGNFIIDQLDGGNIWRKYKSLHGIVSFQPINDGVDEELTVQQHLILYARNAGIPEQSCDDLVAEMIIACQLCGKKAQKAGELTKGMLRRLTLGMALIGRPKLVVLSNPLEGVDPQAKSKLVETIMKYTEGRALLMTTTNCEIAERIGDRVAMLHDGRLINIGSVNEILEHNGMGFSLEVQADMRLLSAYKHDLLSGELDHIENHNQARDTLEQIQVKLEEANAMVACESLSSEYSSNGQLSALFIEVEESETTARTKFINQALVLNLALLIKCLLPHFDIKISSIQSDLIQLELGTVPNDFREAEFSTELHEVTRGIGIAYFSIGATTLEGVYSKLTSNKHGHNTNVANEPLFLTRQRTRAADTRDTIQHRESIVSVDLEEK